MVGMKAQAVLVPKAEIKRMTKKLKFQRNPLLMTVMNPGGKQKGRKGKMTGNPIDVDYDPDSDTYKVMKSNPKKKKKRREKLVYYCPGSGVGSPAHLPKKEADKYLKQDCGYLDQMRETGESPQYPHIGGTCRVCRQDQYQQNPPSRPFFEKENPSSQYQENFITWASNPHDPPTGYPVKKRKGKRRYSWRDIEQMAPRQEGFITHKGDLFYSPTERDEEVKRQYRGEWDYAPSTVSRPRRYEENPVPPGYYLDPHQIPMEEAYEWEGPVGRQQRRKVRRPTTLGREMIQRDLERRAPLPSGYEASPSTREAGLFEYIDPETGEIVGENWHSISHKGRRYRDNGSVIGAPFSFGKPMPLATAVTGEKEGRILKYGVVGYARHPDEGGFLTILSRHKTVANAGKAMVDISRQMGSPRSWPIFSLVDLTTGRYPGFENNDPSRGERDAFVEYATLQLIPGLDSETAETMRTAIEFMGRSSLQTGRWQLIDYIEGNVIPDLESRGEFWLAADFATAVGFIEAGTPSAGFGYRENAPRKKTKQFSGKGGAARRRKLPAKDFGLSKSRKYPMPNASHAKNAKARARQMLNKGYLSLSDYNKIVRKANKVLRKNGVTPTTFAVKSKRGLRMAANPPSATVENYKRGKGKKSVSGSTRSNKQSVSLKKFESWLKKNGTDDEIKRYKREVTAYKKFHQGKNPTSVTRRLVDVGTGKKVTGRSFGYSMGKSPMETYITPKGSGKGDDTPYLHEYGTHPDGITTSAGKVVIKPLEGKTRITDWIHD